MADIKVRVGSQNAIKVLSSFAGGGGTLGGLSDVDISGVQDGAVLVYNGSTNKFEATLELTPGSTQNLDINGGNF